MNSNYKKLSSNGSVSIPVAMRREMGLERGDPMEVSLQKGVVTLKPYAPRCIFCGTTEKVVKLMDKGVCPGCAARAAQATKGGNGL